MLIPILIFDYELRKEYIIQVYCVNKNRPELNCDGKCYLAEKIAEARKQDEKQANDTFLNQVFGVEGITEFPDFSLTFSSKEFIAEGNDNFYYKIPFSNPHLSSFFVPPRTAIA